MVLLSLRGDVLVHPCKLLSTCHLSANLQLCSSVAHLDLGWELFRMRTHIHRDTIHGNKADIPALPVLPSAQQVFRVLHCTDSKAQLVGILPSDIVN